MASEGTFVYFVESTSSQSAEKSHQSVSGIWKNGIWDTKHYRKSEIVKDTMQKPCLILVIAALVVNSSQGSVMLSLDTMGPFYEHDLT